MLFDFHNTLVMTGSMEGWLKQAASDVNETVDVANVLPVLSTVWARAGARHPDAAWDLDPVVHRIAFEEVLSEESSCSPSLARRMYDLMPEQWVAAPGAVELLAAMKRRGVAVGLLSNTALDPRRRLAELGLLEHLDAVVLSFEEGVVKPDPRFFARAAEVLCVQPGECLYVGDTPGNDGAAVGAGMTCLLVPVVDGRPQLSTAAELLGVQIR
ncbi:MAG TPA: HAD family hydrolase [Propionibacteriaceae bacterium]|nr:HAD family hydrolase [Propionibacteriaceae bacterium]